MSVSIVVKKVEDTATHCTYTFGASGDMVGRVRVEKASGDAELLELTSTGEGPSEQFYLAHAVPRLQRYHEQGTYPARDQWDA